MDSNMIQIDSLNRMPFDDLISLYRQGYKLDERASFGKFDISKFNVGGNSGNEIRSLATCPSTVTTGNSLTLSTTASSGTAPYTYHWTITKPDGSTQTLANQATNTYTFAANGNYGISVYVSDSCADGTGIKSSPPQTCTVTASTAGCVSTGYNCEAGQTGYEVDNCGNRRANSACGGGGGGGGGGADCTNCDSSTNYCLAGQCIPKKYALYGGAAAGVLLLIAILK